MADDTSEKNDFGRFYRATVAPLRRYLSRFLGDPSEAQDVAHDAYLRVFPAEGKRPAEKPQALLYVTARRLAINRIKRRQIGPFVRETAAPDTAVSTEPGVVQEVIARQELELLEHAIAELPPGCRAVLLLRKVEMLSHQEISDRLGIAVSTVEKQYARALRLLRTALASRLDQSAAAPSDAPSQEKRT